MTHIKERGEEKTYKPYVYGLGTKYWVPLDGFLVSVYSNFRPRIKRFVIHNPEKPLNNQFCKKHFTFLLKSSPLCKDSSLGFVIKGV